MPPTLAQIAQRNLVAKIRQQQADKDGAGLDTLESKVEGDVASAQTTNEHAAAGDAADSSTKNTDPQESKLQRARNLLKRAGWQEADFEKYSREQILHRGRLRENEEARHNSLRLENESLKKRLHELEARSQSPSSLQSDNGVAQSRVSAPPSDFDKRVKDFEDEFGPEAAKSLKDAHEAEVAALRGRPAQLEQGERAGSGESSEAQQRESRAQFQAQIAETYPALADDVVFDEFERTGNQLGQLPQYVAARTDPEVARRLIEATATALELDRNVEHGDSTEQQGAARRGVMDITGSARPRARPPVSEQEAFVRSASRALAKRLAGSV